MQTELIALQFERIKSVETSLANGAHYADDPECHPAYPTLVAARQILEEEINRVLKGRPAPTEERRPIMLEIAAADERHQMWERRWQVLMSLAYHNTRFREGDDEWRLSDFLAYAGECCGFATDTTPSRDEEGSVDREASHGPVSAAANQSRATVALDPASGLCVLGTGWSAGRFDLARIIDPVAWSGREDRNRAYAEDDAFRREVSLAKADAILALKTSTPETQTVEGCAFVPPPHWTPVDKYDRHPKTAEQWDSRNDPTGERQALAVRRLNFAADLADPRAPDQMALVHRGDLIDVLGQLVWRTAQSENRREQLERAKPTTPERSMVLEEAAREISMDYAIRKIMQLANDRGLIKVSEIHNALSASPIEVEK